MNRQDFVAIDFETANRSDDSACAIGLVKVKDGKIVDKGVHLIKPPTQEFVFTYVHGLTWSDVAQAPSFGELWPKILPFFDGVEFIAAHNASFDQKILMASCKRHRIPAPRLPFVCSMSAARKIFGIYPTSLSDVCRSLRIPLNHHEALSDAMACAKIMIAASKEEVLIHEWIKARKPQTPRVDA
jgi:DNA polymerase III subunit epsilon